MYMNNKKGVTMVVLAATIIIAIIILTVTVAAVGNSVKNANLVAFREELTTIYQDVLKYYSFTGELPKLDDNKYSIEQIKTMSSNSGKMASEITKNNENQESYFVKIDLSKLQIDKSVRGVLKNDKDVFVVNYPSFNIYYLAGFREGDNYYFSLANLNSNEKFKNDDVVSEEIKFSGDLRVKKIKNNWSNKLNIEILTYIEPGETLSFTLPLGNDESKTLNITTESSKTNQITLETLELIGFSNEEVARFNALNADDKKVHIKKQIGAVVTGDVEIDLFNYDSVAPIVGNDISQSSYPEYNTYTFSVSDTLSGINSIKYEYYMKVDNGDERTYLADSSMYTKSYILEKGKEEVVTGENVTLKIPKNVTSIKFIALDKAGNATDVLTLNTKYPILIKYETVSGTNTSVTFNASVDTTYTLTSFTTALSTNGESYTSPYAHESNVNSFTYTDIAGMNDYIFIKLVAVANGVTETRIVKVSTKDFIKEGTTNKSEATSYNPYIPNGFVHTIGDVRTGFVIQDVSNTKNKYNEFVWIPVDYIISQINTGNIVDNSRTLTSINDFISNWKIDSSVLKSTLEIPSLSELYAEPYVTDTTEYNNMINSIRTYGGFYVARYEAGTTEIRNSTSANTDVIIRKDAYPYNYIKFSNSINDSLGGAMELSKNMYYSSTDIKSNLMYGIEWDAVMYFISIFEKNVSNSTEFGNYTSSSTNRAGLNEAYKTANIYDLAGNLEEWTMEVYNGTTRTVRGGNISIKAAANRNYEYIVGNAYENVGFRPALYII